MRPAEQRSTEVHFWCQLRRLYEGMDGQIGANLHKHVVSSDGPTGLGHGTFADTNFRSTSWWTTRGWQLVMPANG
jgi:hypothetical protein